MLDLSESFQWLAAHTLSRRIGGNEIGELRLQIDQLLVQAVVFAVADYRRGFLVIEAVVLANLVPQLCGTLRGLLFVRGHAARYKRADDRQ